ncbi:MAG: DUF1648 domain-containing protein [Anaerolineae bacterium]|nr:DUF1648 domain-containing protein [Anaerolineae bacterium]
MTFKPLPRADRWYALLVVLGLLAQAFLAARAVLARPVDGLSFVLTLWVLVSLLLAGYLCYRAICAFTLEYWVTRDGVTLVWGLTQQIVPMGRIRRIQRGAPAVGVDRLRPWHWPYTERRRLWGAGVGVVNSYATRPLHEQIILVTDEECYGVSPAEPEKFLEALQERYALGVARELPLELRRPPLWTWPLWRDRTAQVLIALGLIGLLLMFGMLAFRYPSLPTDVPLHFDVYGRPDRIASKAGLFALPLISLLAWVTNGLIGVALYRRNQRAAAYLLWGGAVIVQLIAGVALRNLMR